jgi:hypothetical protein
VLAEGVKLRQQQPWHSSLCGEGAVLHPPDDRARGA